MSCDSGHRKDIIIDEKMFTSCCHIFALGVARIKTTLPLLIKADDLIPATMRRLAEVTLANMQWRIVCRAHSAVYGLDGLPDVARVTPIVDLGTTVEFFTADSEDGLKNYDKEANDTLGDVKSLGDRVKDSIVSAKKAVETARADAARDARIKR